MKAIIKLVLFSILSTLFTSCEENNSEPAIVQEIQGLAQKGPYIVGSSVSIYELNKNLAQTGKSFNSQITDNKGNFSINLDLKTPFIEVKVDGFYFNEVSGEKSSAPLTLYALSDISNKSNINCNIMSSLEKDRVKYLMTQGYSFSDSKAKAKSEILGIFNFSDSTYTSSELLDISKEGDENAMLLAISLILQGYGTVADLSELIANISNDIKEDGTLDNLNLGSVLKSNTIYLRLPAIRQNIEKRYQELGVDTQIPDFEKYIKLFLETTNFQATNVISFPLKGKYGDNILSDSISSYVQIRYSITAYLPKGTSLKITYGPASGSDWSTGTMCDPYNVGWSISSENYPVCHTLYAESSSSLIDNAYIQLDGTGSYKFDFYENESLVPTKTKIVSW